jgi:NAD-dependent dihydropyrimidine dehydrogenase PreA subunit
MYIDKELCKNCTKCLPVCPVGAITLADKVVSIDYESCVECSVCRRLGICPEGAIKQVEEIPYPRILRAAFSDPMHRHESTEILGRGTEEMKTNDVKNEFVKGTTGFSIELGRPGIAAYLRDLDKVTRKVISLGGAFSEYNPVLSLMKDKSTGELKTEVLGERVLSAIAEFAVPEERAIEVLDEMIEFINQELDTVATVSVISRADEEGNIDLLEKLREHHYEPYPNGKVNIGMAIR